jgi:transposase
LIWIEYLANKVVMLDESTRNTLRAQHRVERDGRIRDRIKAVLAYDRGYTFAQIADMLLISESGAREHLKDYEQKAGKLKPSNGGSESKLDAEQTASLVAHLEERTYLKVSEIIAYVQETYGIVYSVSGMTDWLHAHDFSWKKPAIRPGKADPTAQEQWTREYEGILNGGRRVFCRCGASHAQREARLWLDPHRKTQGNSEQ